MGAKHGILARPFEGLQRAVQEWLGHRHAEIPLLSLETLRLGHAGERLAYKFLRRQGYTIVARNFRSIRGEIDLIGWDRDILCFVEVKTRLNTLRGRPEEAVTKFKQGQIRKASLDYLRQANLQKANTRFDIVSVLIGSDGAPVCHVIKRAFS